jgi:cyclophilin family peptidyl-prolyl cis-trans isomerase
MKQHGLPAAFLLSTLAAVSAHATEVAVCTDRGRAVLELEDAASPLTVANFLAYVDMGYYSGMVFHRAIPGFVVQGGGVDRSLRARSLLPPVANESSNGIRNTRGTVALARTDDPDSARAQFFVNLSDNTSLDGSADQPGFTVFARVGEGLGVFEEISHLPTGAAGPFAADVPTPLVAIKSIVRLDEAALAALPADGREAALQSAIEGAAAAGDAAEALRLIGYYRALCAPDSPEIALTEGRMALAAGDRRRALFAIEELLATTDASHPAYEAAAALQLEAATATAPTPQVVGGCAPPAVPSLPDANVASEAEMVAAQRQVREFVAAGEAHLACLARMIDDEDRPADERNAAVGEHNRMVAAMEQIAAAFNERIRIFRTRG